MNLLEKIAMFAKCDNVSDLRFEKSRALEALSKIDKENYSEKEWEEALEYINCKTD